MRKKIFQIICLLGLLNASAQVSLDAPVPNGQSLELLWSLNDAWKQNTSTRSKVSLNGLWQFYPIINSEYTSKIPPKNSGWCYFKVPGIWPGMGYGRVNPGDDCKIYMSSVIPKDFSPTKMNSAWYYRTINVPMNWSNKRIILDFTMLQTSAKVYMDNKEVGALFFPGGRLDITNTIKFGKNQELAILVTAQKDGLVENVFMAPGRILNQKSSISNRGITGDLFLIAEPKKATITDVHIITSYRNKNLLIDTGVINGEGNVYLCGEIFDKNKVVKSFKSNLFDVNKEKKRLKFTVDWMAEKLWDIDNPQNLYVAKLKLLDSTGKLVDEFYPQEFGFREFWSEGRNFILNGSVIHLRSLCNYSMRAGADQSSARKCELFAQKAKETGFNHAIAYNYFFTPGIVGYHDDFYIQTSKNGILTSLTLPHISNFKFDLNDPVKRERFIKYSKFLIRRFQNLPGVVFYAMNHNATGYFGDQNPLKIDGKYAPDPIMEKYKKYNTPDFYNRSQALLSNKLIKEIDSSRPIYNHESGHLGDIFTINCYLNWVPAQERSDWFEHWQNNGVKPLMLVEWGNPHVASWTSYRGPGFIWNAHGVQCLWLNEYNSSIIGDKAYRTNPEKELRYNRQERISKNNKPIYFPVIGGIVPDDDSDLVRAYMVKYNFRDMRARGVSAILPWDQNSFWRCTKKSEKKLLSYRFDNLKQPGIVPDYSRAGGGYWNDAQGEYVPTLIGDVAFKYLQDVIIWIGGAKDDFTEKGHNFNRGETIKKSVIIVNDSRKTLKAKVFWQANDIKKSEQVEIQAGERGFIPIIIDIPMDYKSNKLEINAIVKIDGMKAKKDAFVIDVIDNKPIALKSNIGLYDPNNRSKSIVDKLNIKYKTISNIKDCTNIDLLIVGSNAISNNSITLEELRKFKGKILFLEQDYKTLQKMGFRGNEHGIRNVFPLVKDFNDKIICDWRGASTLTAPYLDLAAWERSDPQWQWNGFKNSRAWRAGHRGNINSVLLEKPSIGNFSPLMECGFDLQYAPVLEYINGDKIIIFSQLDISNRTDFEPQAVEMLKKMLVRLDTSTPQKSVDTWYAGDILGEKLLEKLQIDFKICNNIPENGILIVSSGNKLQNLTNAVKNGLNVLALGLNKTELNRLFPNIFKTEKGKYFSNYISNLDKQNLFKGISNSTLHWRCELEFDAFENNIPLKYLKLGKGNIIIQQVVPWMIDNAEFQYRTSYRRNIELISRLLHNMNVKSKFMVMDYADELIIGVKVNQEFAIPPANIKNRAFITAKTKDTKAEITLNGIVLKKVSILDVAKNGVRTTFIYQIPQGLLKNKNVINVESVDKDINSWLKLVILSKNYPYMDIPISSDDPYRYYRW